MRFLHLTVEDFDVMANPGNSDIVTIGLKESLDRPMFWKGKWGVEGLTPR